MLHIGFTGSSKIVWVRQEKTLRREWEYLRTKRDGIILHHGDCVNWDARAHSIAKEIGFEVHIHPPKNESKRAFCRGCLYIDEPVDYLKRNHNIVDSCTHLFACPHDEEIMRSGTWATVRYARKQNKPITIIWPDGSMS